MTRERIRLQHEQETMLMTLYLHARDARTENPILGTPTPAHCWSASTTTSHGSRR